MTQSDLARDWSLHVYGGMTSQQVVFWFGYYTHDLNGYGFSVSDVCRVIKPTDTTMELQNYRGLRPQWP